MEELLRERDILEKKEGPRHRTREKTWAFKALNRRQPRNRDELLGNAEAVGKIFSARKVEKTTGHSGKRGNRSRRKFGPADPSVSI